MNFMKMNWHVIAISLLIGFSAGILFGQNQKFCGPWKHGGSMKEHMLKKFNRELHLTEEQKQKISAIFDAKHPRMMALHEEGRPKFEAIRNETQAEIRAVLTPEQQVKFEELTAKMESRRMAREKTFRF